MDSSKFYLTVGFIALMAAPLVFTGDQQTNDTESKTTMKQTEIPEASSQPSTSQTPNSSTTKSASTLVNSTVSPNMTKFSFLDEKVTLMGGFAILLFGLLVSNMVLACCICSLRRRVSKWAITRNGNPSDVTEDRYVFGDAGLPADQAVELSAIYTMLDKTAGEGNAEEAHKAEGATATAADPANGDAQSPEQAEALLPEPPADVAEPADVAGPADDVTDVLLVV